MANLYPYGIDTSCTVDILPIDKLVYDPAAVVGQALIRRLSTPHGSMVYIGGDPNYGYDVRALVLGVVSPATLATASQSIQSQCLEDERVQAATVTLTQAGSNLTISIAVTLSNSVPFSLIMNVNDTAFDAQVLPKLSP